MYLPLDGRGPLHGQLVRSLKEAVLAGRLPAGMRFPPTRLLAQQLGVSRNTVLAAYEQLRAEGFMQARVGSGSYVALPGAPVQPRSEPPTRIAAQSAYARRLRRYHDHANIPGRRAPGTLHSFQYGVPFTNPLLTSAWARALSHAAAYQPPNYPPAQGLPALRAAVCEYLSLRRGVQAAPEDVVICTGTQQAISLTARVLLDEGDEVAIEEPQYFAVREALQIHGARLLPVPVDGEGLRTDLLPERPPRLICVTPSHQFPTGALMSLPRRRALLDYANRHECWIFEDDYDGEFRYDAQPHAALAGLDDGRRVIYTGTFSKVLFPSLRLGYIVAPPGLRDDFISAKWCDDFGSPGIEQAALAHFLADGGFERHLRRTAKTLKQRRDVLLESLRRLTGDAVQIDDSHAGMHLVVWLRGRDAAQGAAFIAFAQARGLGLYSIAPYYFEPPDRAGLLFGYGALSVVEIEEAARMFAHCLEAMAFAE
ncbi:PLP-dependent aminotransferase family protein [Lysobacter capsici]|jgi:GntR family transcriptional regulator/MocR family aminotransferase|uniref:Transcriptional regulator, GntR family domain n=1 Tax=Lysobacter capsici AZ78 TaxID=1444315 RepID=A0A120AI00_9GAMM|nr:PLP-dependent aminotransferase family protein [Lysobacter capsici]ALN87285.1 bacterial regulatory, gntR family protein [Lysobacter capsici]KWS06933.1 Transcriptional regulator, GntR family domain [Lysobacter capsici AZ78]UOF13716.1 PLP-dependent aminotransferase family protein [Lysobacter capsici]